MVTIDANVWVAAFDPRDVFHAESMRFLGAVAERRLKVVAPSILLVETACAVARRAASASAGDAALERLRTYPHLVVQAMHADLVATAAHLGTHLMLRGVDAIYAATARLHGAVLVSWDDDLVRRAGAITPAGWLATDGAGPEPAGTE